MSKDIKPDVAPDGDDEPDFVDDGAAFIKDLNGAPEAPLGRCVVEGKAFRIRVIPMKEVAPILVAQRRTSEEGKKEFDSLDTADRIFLGTIQAGVVKADRQPLWKIENVMFLYGTEKGAALLRALYNAVIAANPTLMPSANPEAMRRMFGWF